MEELERFHDLIFTRNNVGYEEHRGKVALVTSAVLTSLSGLFVTMRLCTRAGLIRHVGSDDWAIFAAMACSFVYLAMVVCDADNGLGYHSSTLTRHELQMQLKHLWVAIPFYNTSLTLTKISITLQYLRIFPNRYIRICCYFVLGLLVPFCIWTIVTGFVMCIPVARFWTPSMEGSCLSYEGVWLYNSFMHMAMELFLLALPMPVVARLQLPKSQRVELMAMFSLGGLVIIVSAFRIYSIYLLAKRHDMSWYSAPALTWTVAECNIAIICACLPSLRPLLKHIFRFPFDLPFPTPDVSARIRRSLYRNKGDNLDNDNDNTNTNINSSKSDQKTHTTHLRSNSLHTSHSASNTNTGNHSHTTTPDNIDIEEIYLPQRRFHDFDYDSALADKKLRLEQFYASRLRRGRSFLGSLFGLGHSRSGRLGMVESELGIGIGNGNGNGNGNANNHIEVTTEVSRQVHKVDEVDEGSRPGSHVGQGRDASSRSGETDSVRKLILR